MFMRQKALHKFSSQLNKNCIIYRKIIYIYTYIKYYIDGKYKKISMILLESRIFTFKARCSTQCATENPIREPRAANAAVRFHTYVIACGVRALRTCIRTRARYYLGIYDTAGARTCV